MARRSNKKPKLSELPGVDDPRAELDSATLLAAAQPVLKLLADDLLARAKASPGVTRALKARHEAERKAQRTADGFEQWQQRLVVQVAAAWLLSCVFVRTLEDRGLLGHARIAGPGASDSQQLFFELAPSLTERDYLLMVFRELSRLPGVQDIFDARHNPVWKLAPSAEAAKALLALFRTPSADAPAFRCGQADTRFLGDLYQDLSEDVRKRYALLQTPRFVESFILDRTLERAIERFGLDDTTLIDPTCGSGHFLLGAFDRLYDHRLRAQPGLDTREAARLALDAVFGADINPYAVAIARFRLMLAFIDKAGYGKVSELPVLPLHLVVADSLLHNPQHAQASFAELDGQSAKAWQGELFALEDETAAREVLHRRYAAVVGNPPYITVKDKVLRDRYRSQYATCHRNYSLAAPFCERFFQLSRDGGYVGQITANSFMKREFGKKLIEHFLPTVNLDIIVNTSGAYIPGHGTPTVLLFGSAESPRGGDVLAVLAKRGEPTTPADPERGEVWASIASHWQDVDFENDHISVGRVARMSLSEHPWSLVGGGATELKALLEERASGVLGDIVSAIGRSTVAGDDDVWIAEPGTWARRGLADTVVPLVIGECVRDWSLQGLPEILYPYQELGGEPVSADHPLVRVLWPWRTLLGNRTVFGKQMRASGRKWWEHLEHYADKLKTPMSIAFAFVATHNHFVLDRGGTVFNRSAPVIKLPETASEDDHLALLAYLNSSTACFWMKQVFFDKGNRGEGGGTTAEAWERFFEFDGTKLRGLPLPNMDESQRSEAARRGRELTETARRARDAADLNDRLRDATTKAELEEVIATAEREYAAALALLRRQQESLDWWVYSLFGLAGEELAGAATETRASDVLFARAVTAGDIGERYFALCRLGEAHTVAAQEPGPGHVDAIVKCKQLGLIERPTYKRTFREGFRPMDAPANMRELLLGRLEELVARAAGPSSVALLASELRQDFAGILELLHADAESIVSELASGGAVPFLAGYRYSATGMTKFSQWCGAWDLQRRQDGGEPLEAAAPAKYSTKDFQAAGYYRLRGKLDVPKERFISYPGCESDQDGEPIYGWAGWDHLKRAQVLAGLYNARKNDEAWDVARLTPMLAGLLELIPWVKQWHNEPNAEFDGLRMGDYFETFLQGQCSELGLTYDDLRGWRPPKKTRAKKGRARKPSPKSRAAAQPVPERLAVAPDAASSQGQKQRKIAALRGLIRQQEGLHESMLKEFDLRAAAGAFDRFRGSKDTKLARVRSEREFKRGPNRFYFVTRPEGDSMNKLFESRAVCVFRYPADQHDGAILLVERTRAEDAEAGGSYVVKQWFASKPNLLVPASTDPEHEAIQMDEEYDRVIASYEMTAEEVRDEDNEAH